MTSLSSNPEQVEQAKQPAKIGLNELGRIEIEPRAVEKVAALAALDVPHAGGAAGTLLAWAVSGASGLGRRRSGAERLPKVTAEVDGGLVFLDLELSVRWPAPIGPVTEAVRQHLFARIRELLGLEVSEVNIEVVELATADPAARVA